MSARWEPLRLMRPGARPDPPAYVVDGVLARDAVTVLSGDTGAAKSMIAMALISAALNGHIWLGREVTARRPLVIDDENPPHEVYRRMAAFGVHNGHAGALRYYNRQGVLLDNAANVTRLAQHTARTPDRPTHHRHPGSHDGFRHQRQLGRGELLP